MALTRSRREGDVTELALGRELTEAEMRTYLNALRHLREFGASRPLIKMAEANAAEMMSTVDRTAGLKTDGASDVNTFRALVLELERRLLNYLNSAIMYLNASKVRLKRRYGRASPEVGAFEAAMERAWESSAAYRVLYAIRNHVQHTAPILASNIRGAPAPSTGSLRTTYFVGWHRDLIDATDWGNIRSDLLSLPEEFELHQMVPSFAEVLRRIDRAGLAAEAPAVFASASALMEILHPEFRPGYSPIVVRRTEYADGTSNLSYLDPPWHVIAAFKLAVIRDPDAGDIESRWRPGATMRMEATD